MKRFPGCKFKACGCALKASPTSLDAALDDYAEEVEIGPCGDVMRERLKAFVAGLVAEATEKGRELEREDWENSR